MWTCGSINPGKTSLPVASITSHPDDGVMSRSMRVIVSFSQKRSATNLSEAVTIWPFLMRSGIVRFVMKDDLNRSKKAALGSFNRYLLTIACLTCELTFSRMSSPHLIPWLTLLSCVIHASGQNWPSFRGAYAEGIAKGAVTPSTWNVEHSENIL